MTLSGLEVGNSQVGGTTKNMGPRRSVASQGGPTYGTFGVSESPVASGDSAGVSGGWKVFISSGT